MAGKLDALPGSEIFICGFLELLELVLELLHLRGKIHVAFAGELPELLYLGLKLHYRFFEIKRP